MNSKQRLELAKKSLKGISIGDAFGESFFGETGMITDCIGNRKIPETVSLQTKVDQSGQKLSYRLSD